MLKIWRNRWVRVALFILVGIFYVFSICPVLSTLYFLWQDQTPLSDVEEFIGVKVPQTATDIHYLYRSWQGVGIYLRFSVKGNDASTYIANLEQGKECTHVGPEDNFSPFGPTWDRTDWFKPSSVQVYAGQECTSRGKVYYLLLDKTNSVLQTIYLFSGAG